MNCFDQLCAHFMEFHVSTSSHRGSLKLDLTSAPPHLPVKHIWKIEITLRPFLEIIDLRDQENQNHKQFYSSPLIQILISSKSRVCEECGGVFRGRHKYNQCSRGQIRGLRPSIVNERMKFALTICSLILGYLFRKSKFIKHIGLRILVFILKKAWRVSYYSFSFNTKLCELYRNITLHNTVLNKRTTDITTEDC